MKVIAAYMAVWVLFLSLLPCNDVDDHGHASALVTAHETVIVPDHPASHDAEMEHCAPFCHCNCCQSSTTINDVILTLPDHEQVLPQYPILHDQFEAQHPASVWHPPIA